MADRAAGEGSGVQVGAAAGGQASRVAEDAGGDLGAPGQAADAPGEDQAPVRADPEMADHAGERGADVGLQRVNLRGFDPAGSPTPAATAIRALLDALEAPAERIPASLDAQVGLYRSLMADKRMLLVLDNARDAEQVRPLLPGSPGCLVLVTSRSHLTGLAAVDGAHSLRLGLLTGAEARALLAARLGPARVDAEPGAAAELVRLCAGLPLALAIASAQAAARADFPLAAQVAELRNSADRLDVLDTGDPAASLRSVFSWSYRQLSPVAARMFRLLGTHPGPDISVGAAASLAGCECGQARHLLATLADAHLLTEHVPGRYACHDLLRAYAVSQAQATDSGPDREAAASRVLDHYVHTGHSAARLLNPSRVPLSLDQPRPGVTPGQCRTSQQALAWFEAEHHVLLAAVAFAAETGSDLHAWQIPWTMADFLDRRGRWTETVASQDIAVAAAARLGDIAGQAAACLRLAFAYARLADYPQACAQVTTCLKLYQQLGDSDGQARAYQTLSYIAERQGHHAEALSHGEQALRLLQATNNIGRQAVSLNDTGWCHAQLGNYQQAQSFCEQALVLWGELGDHNGAAHTWDTLGYIAHHRGQHAQAAANYQHALALFRELGDLYNEADILTHLGDNHHAAGDPEGARGAWQQALSILTGLHHPHAARVRANLQQLGQNGTGPAPASTQAKP